MKLNYYALLGIIALSGFCTTVHAQTTDQKSYNLFHPVPTNKLREMETDRPDVTESPYTVDAGHIQYETDFLRHERQEGETGDQHKLLFNQGNLKLGLFNSTSLQVGFESFVWQKEQSNGETMRTHGFGDINIRIKQNLLGDYKGSFALAVLPYIKFPTARYSDSKYEGGIIVPMSIHLPGEWELGSQVQADRFNDEDSSTMHTEFLQSLTINHELFKDVEGIAETYYTYDFNAHHWSNFLNASAVLKVSKNFNLDAGLNYGLQADAQKSYFLGTSFRF